MLTLAMDADRNVEVSNLFFGAAHLRLLGESLARNETHGRWVAWRA